MGAAGGRAAFGGRLQTMRRSMPSRRVACALLLVLSGRVQCGSGLRLALRAPRATLVRALAPPARSGPGPRAQAWRLFHGGHSHTHGHEHSHGDGLGEPFDMSSFLTKQRVLRLGAATALAAFGLAVKLNSQWVNGSVLFGAAVLLMLDVLTTALNQAKSFGGTLIRGWRNHRVQTVRYSREAMARHKEADVITMAGIWVNVGLTVSKFVAGKMGNSAALLADAGHSLSDLLSDFVTLWTIRMARLPPDADHPYGHGRFEQLGSLFVSGLLILTGWHFGGALALSALLPAFSGHGHGHGHALPDPSFLTVGVAAVSIVAKELIYRSTARVGRRLNSPVLLANAWHHRSDALSSVVALVGVCGAKLGFLSLDSWAGALVASMVVLAGLQVGSDAIKGLSDTADPRLVADLREAVGAVPGVKGFRKLRARRMGAETHVDVIVEVEQWQSAAEAQAATDRVKVGVMNAVPTVTEVLVRLESGAAAAPAEGPCPLVAEERSSASIRRRVLEAVEAHRGERGDAGAFEGAPSVHVDYEERRPKVDVVLRGSGGHGLEDLRAEGEGLRERILRDLPEAALSISLELSNDRGDEHGRGHAHLVDGAEGDAELKETKLNW